MNLDHHTITVLFPGEELVCAHDEAVRADGTAPRPGQCVRFISADALGKKPFTIHVSHSSASALHCKDVVQTVGDKVEDTGGAIAASRLPRKCARAIPSYRCQAKAGCIYLPSTNTSIL